MRLIFFLIGLFLVVNTKCLAGKEGRRFPAEFIFGVSTASYQIEGAWNEDGKGENIWDYLTHTKPEVIGDLSNGDVAADSYHNYKRDVEMLRELDVDAYRFSLSWSRILPTGFTNNVNQAGVEYYNNLIDELIKHNIDPMVTLYHWDLPQKLQELGGFANPLIADWFEEYARVAFKHYGDRVKLWITFNEPKEICVDGYGYTYKAPMVNSSGIGVYLCAKNLVMAHARAYHAYNEFRIQQKGQCGITFSVGAVVPYSDSEQDRSAVEINDQAMWRLYAEPIFSEQGGFSKEFSERVASRSAKEGYSNSRLPRFEEEEIDYIRGTSDFFGVNHYGGYYVTPVDDSELVASTFYGDVGTVSYGSDDWPKSVSSWLSQMPNSVYITLDRIRTNYKDIPIYITENGWSTYAGLEDDDRVNYYRAALDSALDALDAGINLKGYMAWSLMDNFEWMEGYAERFGLYEVDFNDSNRTRTPRKSAFVYKQTIKTRSVDHSYEPESMSMTIDDGH